MIAALKPLPRWSLAAPPAALVLLLVTWGREPGVVLGALAVAALVAGVVSAVHHAEVIAHKVGDPYGSLILAVAVTIIEVGLIVMLMVSGGDKTASLARDTVFAAVMITCNLIVGLCLLAGPIRHRVVRFHAEGSSGALAVVVALVTLSLVLPTFTRSSPGPTFTPSQLAYAGVVSLVLYGVFVFVQTVRHRDYFLPVGEGAGAPDHARVAEDGEDPEEPHGPELSAATTWASAGLLLICLVAVVGLAKVLSKPLEHAVDAVGAPIGVVGVVIALVVLAPETVAAVRAAQRDRMQTSLNLALGSAMASIGLTIPAIALASIWLHTKLELGLGGTEIVLLALTVAISTLTLTQGRANVLQGSVHLAVFASYLFLAFTP